MRRIILLIIILSMGLAGCNPMKVKPSKDVTERQQIAFEKWTIPSYFIPKTIHVVGLGDSLTEGVGDERKKGGYFGRVTGVMVNWKGIKDVEAENLSKRGRRSDQLNDQLLNPDVQAFVKDADVIFLTIGGNDLMKVVKENLFNLTKKPFYDELELFENRIEQFFGTVRALNDEATIVALGLYNPFSIVTADSDDFTDILDDWNEAIEVYTVLDNKSCFVPVNDLFESNTSMVYHTDFFHPNANGYEKMTNRILNKLEQCGLRELSGGELEM